MASLSDDLKIILLALGDEGYGPYSNYGDAENANWLAVESALTGKSDITITTTNVTLTDDQQVSLYLNLSGALTGDRDLILKADQQGFWFVNNATTGDFDVTIKPSGGTGFAVPQDARTVVVSDGDVATLIVTSFGTFGPDDVTPFARTLLDDADAAAARTTLGITQSLVLLDTKTPAAASSVVFNTGFSSDYDEYIFQFVGLQSGSDGGGIFMELSNNAGVSWLGTVSYTDFYVNATGVGQAGSDGFTGAYLVRNLDASAPIFGKATLLTTATHFGVMSQFNTVESTGTNDRNSFGGATGPTSGRINAVRFTNGNNMTGKIRMFGVKNT